MAKTIKNVLCSVVAIMLVVATVFTTNLDANAAGIDYSSIFDATYYAAKYPDLVAIYGNDATALFNHFITTGVVEGRQGSEEFNVNAYRARYADLNKVYGNNLKMYYLHYALVGKTEGRNGRADGVTPAIAATPVIPTPVAPTQNPASTEIPANAIPHGNGYFLQDIGQDVCLWINTQRTSDNKSAVTWSPEIARFGTNRAKEISIQFSSGRPDGTPWMTAYGDKFGDYGIKEMILQQNGVATAASVEALLANNTDRMNYIKNDKFLKCGISVYTENNKSYIIVAFQQIVEEKEDK